MAVEIERKFKVNGDQWRLNAYRPRLFVQGYLSPGVPTVRVRLDGDKAYLTIKGPTSGISRDEFEYEIPFDDGRLMIDHHCAKNPIKKIRYLFDWGGKTWEIDEFQEQNEGLIIAEVTLCYESEEFEHPPWLGEEVTQDKRYYNAKLSERPFKHWNAT